MLQMQSNILPATHLLEQVKICLKSTVKTSLRLLLENILTSTNKDLKAFDLFNSIKRDVLASFLHSFEFYAQMFLLCVVIAVPIE